MQLYGLAWQGQAGLGSVHFSMLGLAAATYLMQCVAPDGITTTVDIPPTTLSAFTGLIGVAPLETKGPMGDVFDGYVDR
jgi:hypothetical protein